MWLDLYSVPRFSGTSAQFHRHKDTADEKQKKLQTTHPPVLSFSGFEEMNFSVFVFSQNGVGFYHITLCPRWIRDRPQKKEVIQRVLWVLLSLCIQHFHCIACHVDAYRQNTARLSSRINQQQYPVLTSRPANVLYPGFNWLCSKIFIFHRGHLTPALVVIYSFIYLLVRQALGQIIFSCIACHLGLHAANRTRSDFFWANRAQICGILNFPSNHIFCSKQDD